MKRLLRPLIPIAMLAAAILAERLDQAAARIVVNEAIGARKDAAIAICR
jgi:hypothetical protein